MPERVLIVAPGAAADDGMADALADAARGVGVDVQHLTPASENALRQRLSAGDVTLLVYCGSGRSRAAGHRTVDFDGSDGGEARAVNLRHLGGLLAAAPALRGIVLLSRAGAAQAPHPLDGFAAALVEHGAPAAVVWQTASVGALALSARTWFERWLAGVGWGQLAKPDAALPQVLDWAGGDRAGAALAVAAAAVAAAPAASPSIRPADAADPQALAIERQLAAKREAGRFDVFMCHNSADKPAVRTVARALRAGGVLPWLDEWELPPGQPWQPLLEQQIEHIRSAAVFVGRAGVGPWQEQELYGFLREFVARRAPVIPVLLPDAPSAPELPLFLRAMTYVDFRQQEPEPLARLIWGITGVRPAYS